MTRTLVAGRFSAGEGYGAPLRLRIPSRGNPGGVGRCAVSRAHFSRASGVGDRPLIGRVDAAKTGNSAGLPGENV